MCICWSKTITTRQGRASTSSTPSCRTAELRCGADRTGRTRTRELMELLTASGFAVELAEAWTRDAHSVSLVATRV